MTSGLGTRARWWAGAGALLVVAVVAVLRSSSGPGAPPGGEEGNPPPALAAGEVIAFVRAGPGQTMVGHDTSLLSDPDIFTLGANGRARNLTQDPEALELAPAWSPDGTRIVFMRGTPQPYLLYMARSDGSKMRPLTHCGEGYCQDGSLAWSPDGRAIAFHRIRDGEPTGIFVVDSQGGRPKPIRRMNSFGGLSWSPDGETIVYSTPVRGGFSLFLMDSDGSNPRPLLDCSRPACFGHSGPAWSPDGSWIAFVGCCGDSEEDGDLFLIRPDGTGLRRLVDCPNDCEVLSSPTWSPDGTRIAVEEARGTRGDLVLVRVSDGAQSTLTRNQRLDCCPAFRPAGSG